MDKLYKKCEKHLKLFIYMHKLYKKCEKHLKLFINNRLFYFYKNKYYKVNSKKTFTAWQELKTNTPVVIKSWGTSLYQGNHGLLQYLVNNQDIHLYNKSKDLQLAKTILIHGYFVNTKTLKACSTAKKKGIIPIFVEDGFIRSVSNVHNKSMPQDLKQALAYTLDDLALHFDANKISRLESN